MLDFLRRPLVILLSLIANIALGIGFFLWMPHVGGTILDSVASVDDTSALLASMSEAQKTSHFWMTLCLDILFPLTFGAFFAGMALRFPGRLGLLLAVPAFAVLSADILENITQLFALKDNLNLLPAKAVLTPLKSFLFNVAALIALASLVWIAVKSVMSRVKA